MWFSKREYKVIEVEKPRTTLPVDGPEVRDGLRALAGNPFFKVLVDRLRVQRYAIEAALKTTRFSNISEASFLQQGVFWTGWLERELDRLTQQPPKPHLDAEEQELEAFRQIDSMLERVGE